MKDVVYNSYRGWQIKVSTEHTMCSNFRFDLCDPSGRTQHVPLGGDTAERAMERAREMIDMEIEFAEKD